MHKKFFFETSLYLNSLPFCRNKKKSSEADVSTCSPLDDTPPKWSAKRGDMDFEPTRKRLVVAEDKL